MTHSFLKWAIFGGMILRLAAKSFPQKSPSALQRACHSSSEDEETILKNKNNPCLLHLRMVL